MQKKHFIRQAFSIHKNKRAGYPEIPETCPLLSLYSCATFCAIAEVEYHPADRIDRCVIHKPVEQLPVEIRRQHPHFAKFCKESTENVILDFLRLPLFFHAVHPDLNGGVPASIPVIFFAIVVNLA